MHLMARNAFRPISGASLAAMREQVLMHLMARNAFRRQTGRMVPDLMSEVLMHLMARNAFRHPVPYLKRTYVHSS